MRPPHPLAVSEAERERLATASQHAQAGAVDPLLAMLADPSWRVRREVVSALARLGDAAVPGLCETLASDRGDEARVAATVDALAGSGSVEALSAYLADLAGHADPAVVADVAQIIGRRRQAADVPILTRLVEHADENVAVAAIEGLGKIGGRAAVDTLLGSLRGGSFFRVFPAIDVLGRTGDPRVVEPLAALLADPTYRLEAVRGLGRTGELAAVAPLAALLAQPGDALVRVVAVALRDLVLGYQHHYGPDERARESLRQAAARPGLTARMIAVLRSATGDEQQALVFLLGIVGDASVLGELMPLLEGDELRGTTTAAAIESLAAGSPDLLAAALAQASSAQRRLLLPRVTSRTAAPAMIAALEDPEPDVRTLACRALARTGAVSSVPALFALLADRSPPVSQAAQAAILALGTDDTVSLARAATADARPEVRRAALRILATLGDEKALPEFLAAVSGGDARMADIAVGGLAALASPEAIEALLEAAQSADDGTRGAAMRALGRTESADPRIGESLTRGVADRRPWVRYYAVQALGRQAVPGVSTVLVPLLDDPAGQVRVAAVEALSTVDDPAAFAALARAERQSDPDLRRAALIGLANSRRSDPDPILLRASESSDAATRLVALSGLVQRQSSAVLGVLERLLHDEDELVQRAAAQHAATLGTPGTLRLLLESLRAALRDGGDRDRLVALLAAAGPAAAHEIALDLRSADDDYAVELTRVLLRARSPVAVEVLLAAMGDGSVPGRKACAAALHALGTVESLDALRRCALKDGDPAVRQVCAALLGT